MYTPSMSAHNIFQSIHKQAKRFRSFIYANACKLSIVIWNLFIWLKL